MAYQEGSATQLAVMTGNPYVVAGAAIFDAYNSMKSVDATNEAAEELRAEMIEGQVLENRAVNLAFQDEMEKVADGKLAEQIAALEAESSAKAADTGVGGVTRDKAIRSFNNKLGQSIQRYERASENAEKQMALKKERSNHSLNGRINKIERAVYEPVGDLVNLGLTIAGQHQSEQNRQESLNTARGGSAGAQSVELE